MAGTTVAQGSFTKRALWNKPLDQIVLGMEVCVIQELFSLSNIYDAARPLIIEESEVLKMKLSDAQTSTARPLTFDRFSKGMEIGIICAAVAGVLLERLGWFGVGAAFTLGFLLGLFSIRKQAPKKI